MADLHVNEICDMVMRGENPSMHPIWTRTIIDQFSRVSDDRVDRLVDGASGWLGQEARAEQQRRVSKAHLKAAEKAVDIQTQIADLTAGISAFVQSQDATNQASQGRMELLNQRMERLTQIGTRCAIGALAVAVIALGVSVFAWRYPQNPSERPKSPEVRVSEDSASLPPLRPVSPPAPTPSSGNPDSESTPVPPPADSTSKAGTSQPVPQPPLPAPPPQEAAKPDAAR